MNEKQIEELMKVKIEELEHLLEKKREAALKNCSVKPRDVVVTAKGEFIGIFDIRVDDWDTRIDKLLEEDSLRIIIGCCYFLGSEKLNRREISFSTKELGCLKRIGTFTYDKDTLVLESLNIVNK